jgi:hypothetical protein
MLTNQSERIGERGQDFGVPGCLANGKRLAIQQLLRKNGDQRKKAHQDRSGAHNRHIRPLALSSRRSDERAPHER